MKKPLMTIFTVFAISPAFAAAVSEYQKCSINATSDISFKYLGKGDPYSDLNSQQKQVVDASMEQVPTATEKWSFNGHICTGDGVKKKNEFDATCVNLIKRSESVELLQRQAVETECAGKSEEAPQEEKEPEATQSEAAQKSQQKSDDKNIFQKAGGAIGGAAKTVGGGIASGAKSAVGAVGNIFKPKDKNAVAEFDKAVAAAKAKFEQSVGEIK
jgi:hypothetical protein